jgi:hypothetical protein
LNFPGKKIYAFLLTLMKRFLQAGHLKTLSLLAFMMLPHSGQVFLAMVFCRWRIAWRRIDLDMLDIYVFPLFLN